MEGDFLVNGVVYKYGVTKPMPKKCILDLQWKNGKTVTITTGCHSHTRDIPIR